MRKKISVYLIILSLAVFLSSLQVFAQDEQTLPEGETIPQEQTYEDPGQQNDPDETYSDGQSDGQTEYTDDQFVQDGQTQQEGESPEQPQGDTPSEGAAQEPVQSGEQGQESDPQPAEPVWLDIDEDQLYILQSLYYTDMTETGRIYSGWFAEGDYAPCSWSGITCEWGRITGLAFQDAFFFKTFPQSVLGLKDLKTLSFRDTLLKGPLPESLFRDLPALEVLELSGNFLTGEMPPLPDSSSPLQELVISDNLEDDRKLQLLGFPQYSEASYYQPDQNEFPGVDLVPGLDGSLPENWWQVPSLYRIDLSGNQLSGSVPDAFSQLQLSELNLSGNAEPLTISDWLYNAFAEAAQYNPQIIMDGIQAPAAEVIPEPTEEPYVEPTEEPYVEPTEDPYIQPVEDPYVEPTEDPYVQLLEQPYIEPMEDPYVQPVEDPYVEPFYDPNAVPTEDPYIPPTEIPYVEPTEIPYIPPTEVPYVEPTEIPYVPPTEVPYVEPTEVPYIPPIEVPYVEPTEVPYIPPTEVPYVEPTEVPYIPPTEVPYVEPTQVPYIPPTEVPYVEPTQVPYIAPVIDPVIEATDVPYVWPTDTPAVQPTQVQPTAVPVQPTQVQQTQVQPTARPIIIVVTATPAPQQWYTATPYNPQPYIYPTATPYNLQPYYIYPTATPYSYYNPGWVYPTATSSYSYQYPVYEPTVSSSQGPAAVPTQDQASLLGFTYKLETMTENNIPMTWRYTGMQDYSIVYLDSAGNLYPAFGMEWTPASEICNSSVCNASVSVPEDLLAQGKFSLQLRVRDASGRTYNSDPVMMEVSMPVQPTPTPVPEKPKSVFIGFLEWLFSPIIRLFGGGK